MAVSMVVRAWWDRLRGRLAPRPCPFADAAVLETPLRGLVASSDRVLHEFGVAVGERVLEIGPGVGYYSLEVARRVGANGRLCCLDIQDEMLLETRRRLRQAGRPDAGFVCGDAAALPFRSGAFDRIVLITVLGEIPARSQALNEFHRVLRDGGRLSVSEQFPDPDFTTRRALRCELRPAGFVEERTRGHLWYTSTWRTASGGRVGDPGY